MGIDIGIGYTMFGEIQPTPSPIPSNVSLSYIRQQGLDCGFLLGYQENVLPSVNDTKHNTLTQKEILI